MASSAYSGTYKEQLTWDYTTQTQVLTNWLAMQMHGTSPHLMIPSPRWDMYFFRAGLQSWKSTKQTLTTTSSNHAKVIALYEACRECIWLCQLLNHIHASTGWPTLTTPMTIFKNNCPCVNQITKGFIKGDRIKHIAPKFFYTAEQHCDHINIVWISSRENRADLFTKPLPKLLHNEHCDGIGMRCLSALKQPTWSEHCYFTSHNLTS